MKIFTAAKIFLNGSFVENHSIVVIRDLIEDIVPSQELANLKQFAEIYDFGDSFIIPGFIDTHTHMIGHGLNQLSSISNFCSFEEVKDYISDAIRQRKEEVFIFTDFDESRWKERKFPEKKDLDEISEKPIFLRRICGHIGIGNSAFIEMLSKMYPSVAVKLNYEKGIFWEDVPLQIHSLFPPSSEALEMAFQNAQSEFIRNGITTIHEIGSLRNFRFFQEMMRKGKLKLRSRYYVSGASPEDYKRCGIEYGFGNALFKFQGLKYFADGSVGAESALFSFEYGSKKEKGMWLLPENMENILREAVRANLQVAIHAIGNLAIREVLNLIEKINNVNLVRIEHFEFPDMEDIERAAKMSIKISVQPNFALNWGTENGLYQSKIGEHYKKNNPLNTLKEKNVNFAFGSDAMPPSPLFGIQAATEHPNRAEAIDLTEAILRYTAWGAHLTEETDTLGKIERGYTADFVVTDTEIKKIKATVISGEIISNG